MQLPGEAEVGRGDIEVRPHIPPPATAGYLVNRKSAVWVVRSSSSKTSRRQVSAQAPLVSHEGVALVERVSGL
jgi:hypothetical protein